MAANTCTNVSIIGTNVIISNATHELRYTADELRRMLGCASRGLVWREREAAARGPWKIGHSKEDDKAFWDGRGISEWGEALYNARIL